MIVDDGSGMVLDMEIFRSFDDLDALCQAVVRFVLDAAGPRRYWSWMTAHRRFSATSRRSWV